MDPGSTAALINLSGSGDTEQFLIAELSSFSYQRLPEESEKQLRWNPGPLILQITTLTIRPWLPWLLEVFVVGQNSRRHSQNLNQPVHSWLSTGNTGNSYSIH